MDFILSLLMLAAVALLCGAAYLWKGRKARKQALLMLVLAAIMLINVAIWTIPDESGADLMDRAAEISEQTG